MLERDGEQVIRDVWHGKEPSSNCWAIIYSKLLACGRKLQKWDADKKKVSKKDLEDKVYFVEEASKPPIPELGSNQIF